MSIGKFLLLVGLIIASGISGSGKEAIAAKAGQPEYPVKYQWDRGGAWFTNFKQTFDSNRWRPYGTTTQPSGRKVKIPAEAGWFGFKYLTLTARDAYLLMSVCRDENDFGCFDDAEPVLFIHGYAKYTSKISGGGEDTWGDFPRLMQEKGLVPFEYRWNTGTRYEDAARELHKAINKIYDVTGKRVHVVAHSLGGVLLRTLLQGIHLIPEKRAVHRVAMALRIASSVTIGSPHSGIFNHDFSGRNICRNNIGVPKGVDTYGNINTPRACGQLSCQQLGQDMVDGEAADFFEVEDEPGELVPKLADLERYPLPEVDILALIGLTTTRYTPNSYDGYFDGHFVFDLGSEVIDPGDGLITAGGQRFFPQDAVNNPLAPDCDPSELEDFWAPLRYRSATVDGGVTERLLGLPPDVQPFDDNPDPSFLGYRHSINSDKLNGISKDTPVEPHVVCETADNCNHAAYLAVLDWISTHSKNLSSDENPTYSGTLEQGETVTFSGKVYNEGAAINTAFSDNFTYCWGAGCAPGAAGVGGQIGSHIAKPIPFGAGSVLDDTSAPFTLSQAGTLRVQHCVDSQSQIAESDETDNCRTSDFIVNVVSPTGDLMAVELEQLSYDPADGDGTTGTYNNIRYRFKAVNNGAQTIAVGAYLPYKILVESDPAHLSPSPLRKSLESGVDYWVGGLISGGDFTYLTEEIDGVPFGENKVTGRVNLDGATLPLSDTNLDNNKVEGTFVLPVPQPPMSIFGATTPYLVRSGETATIRWSVEAHYPSLTCEVTGPAFVKETFKPVDQAIGPKTGQKATGPLTSGGIYRLICTESITNTVFTKTMRVEVIPTVGET